MVKPAAGAGMEAGGTSSNDAEITFIGKGTFGSVYLQGEYAYKYIPLTRAKKKDRIVDGRTICPAVNSVEIEVQLTEGAEYLGQRLDFLDREDDFQWYEVFSMPYYEGRTLKACVRDPSATELKKLFYLRSYLLQIKTLHFKKIIHLDEHFNNVIVSPEDELHFIDFGLAHRVDQFYAPFAFSLSSAPEARGKNHKAAVEQDVYKVATVVLKSVYSGNFKDLSLQTIRLFQQATTKEPQNRTTLQDLIGAVDQDIESASDEQSDEKKFFKKLASDHKFKSDCDEATKAAAFLALQNIAFNYDIRSALEDDRRKKWVANLHDLYKHSSMIGWFDQEVLCRLLNVCVEKLELAAKDLRLNLLFYLAFAKDSSLSYGKVKDIIGEGQRQQFLKNLAVASQGEFLSPILWVQLLLRGSSLSEAQFTKLNKVLSVRGPEVALAHMMKMFESLFPREMFSKKHFFTIFRDIPLSTLLDWREQGLFSDHGLSFLSSLDKDELKCLLSQFRSDSSLGYLKYVIRCINDDAGLSTIQLSLKKIKPEFSTQERRTLDSYSHRKILKACGFSSNSTIKCMAYGSSGVIFKVTEAPGGRSHAVKVSYTRPGEFSDEAFQSEVKNLKRLGVRCRAERDFVPELCNMIVMPFFEGEALDEILSSEESTVCEKTSAILKSTEALQRLHDKGMIHGNLKANKFIVNASGVKLVGMGYLQSAYQSRLKKEMEAGLWPAEGELPPERRSAGNYKFSHTAHPSADVYSFLKTILPVLESNESDFQNTLKFLSLFKWEDPFDRPQLWQVMEALSRDAILQDAPQSRGVVESKAEDGSEDSLERLREASDKYDFLVEGSVGRLLYSFLMKYESSPQPERLDKIHRLLDFYESSFIGEAFFVKEIRSVLEYGVLGSSDYQRLKTRLGEVESPVEHKIFELYHLGFLQGDFLDQVLNKMRENKVYADVLNSHFADIENLEESLDSRKEKDAKYASFVHAKREYLAEVIKASYECVSKRYDSYPVRDQAKLKMNQAIYKAEKRFRVSCLGHRKHRFFDYLRIAVANFLNFILLALPALYKKCESGTFFRHKYTASEKQVRDSRKDFVCNIPAPVARKIN